MIESKKGIYCQLVLVLLFSQTSLHLMIFKQSSVILWKLHAWQDLTSTTLNMVSDPLFYNLCVCVCLHRWVFSCKTCLEQGSWSCFKCRGSSLWVYCTFIYNCVTSPEKMAVFNTITPSWVLCFLFSLYTCLSGGEEFK